MKISAEELVHQIEKAKEVLGKSEISAEEYARLGDEAAADERFYVAAIFFHLAEGQSLPSMEADKYKDKTREMLWRAEAEKGAPPELS